MPTLEGTLIQRESRSENFQRSFELDPSIDAGKISAKIEQGVVTLTLPKAAQDRRRVNGLFWLAAQAASREVCGLSLFSDTLAELFFLANFRSRRT